MSGALEVLNNPGVESLQHIVQAAGCPDWRQHRHGLQGLHHCPDGLLHRRLGGRGVLVGGGRGQVPELLGQFIEQTDGLDLRPNLRKGNGNELGTRSFKLNHYYEWLR